MQHVATSVCLRNVVAQRQPATEKSIPKLVLSTFKEQNPKVLQKGWYGQCTGVIYTYEKPNYFEVEFIDNPGELSRAIYNKYGYWYETRTQIKGLTMEILDALKASKYNGWKISQIKEKVASSMWPVEIYRFQVSIGLKSLIIRMDAEGNIIQKKVIK